MMFDRVCTECGSEFVAMTMFTQMCSSKCRQRRYRKGAKGKANVLKFNAAVKRPDIKKVCEVCSENFMTARKSQRVCSENECQKRGKYLVQKRYRNNYPDRARARGLVGKRIQRGASMQKEPCSVCGEEAEMHHPDYAKPLEVVWLCKKHHHEVHKHFHYR